MSIASIYKRFRKDSPFMLVGENAKLALESAKALALWNRLESAGLVRIEVEPEPEPDASFYDTWEHLSPRTREKLRGEYYNNCWLVETSYKLPGAGWRHADLIGNCAGYEDPSSPFENPYVIDLMNSAIEQLRNELKSRCPVCRHAQ